MESASLLRLSRMNGIAASATNANPTLNNAQTLLIFFRMRTYPLVSPWM
jgi:hypothetical protein